MHPEGALKNTVDALPRDVLPEVYSEASFRANFYILAHLFKRKLHGASCSFLRADIFFFTDVQMSSKSGTKYLK